MTILSKWWPSIVVAAGALYGAFGAQIQGDISKHPAWASVIAGVVAVGTHLLPSPVVKS